MSGSCLGAESSVSIFGTIDFMANPFAGDFGIGNAPVRSAVPQSARW